MPPLLTDGKLFWVEIDTTYAPPPVAKVDPPDQFVPCEELFSHWITARIILTEVVEKLGPLQIGHEGNAVMLHMPLGLPLETLPPEDRPKIEEIMRLAVERYLPDLTKFYGAPITDLTKNQIRIECEANERNIVYAGGRTMKGYLKFVLGLTPYAE